MRTFIQLHNGIGYAVLHTEGEPDHSVTPDHITAIEVFTSDPDQFLKKKYSESTKSWSDAELIVFAELNDRGEIIEVRRTYFEHEVTGPIITPDVAPNAMWINNEWVTPQIIMPEQPAVAAPTEIEPPAPLN